MTVGFQGADESYFLISWVIHSTEQDRRLGLNGVYVELNDQGWSCYDGIGTVTVTPGQLHIELNYEGGRALQVPLVEIEHDLPPERSHQMRTVLSAIFSGFGRYADFG